MIQRAANAWNRYWFSPQRATDLALCRVAFYGYLLYKNWHLDSSRWSDFAPELWFPMPLFEALGLGLLPASTLRILDGVWKLSLASACAGLFTRTASVVAFVVGLYLLGVPHNFGKIHHSDAQLIFILAAMALAKSGEHLSLDALLRRYRKLPASPLESGEYRWPIRFAWLTWVIVYFSAGMAKLRMSGLGWANAEDMRNRLLLHHYTHAPPTEWGLWIAEHEALCTALAVTTLVIEVGSPVALFSARARALFVPALGLMQLGIWLCMGVKFGGFVAAYIFWLPWGWVLGLRASLRRA